MNAPGRIINGLAPPAPIEVIATPAAGLNPAPVPRRRRPRRRHRKCYYAMAATQHEITLPRLKPLGYLTQSRLIQRAQAGDIEAKQIVWLHNARLAYTVANRVRVRPDLVADAVQEAQLGLSRAIDRFDIDRLYVLSTYAFRAMERTLLRFRGFATFARPIPPVLQIEYARFRRRLARVHSPSDWFDLRMAYLDRDPRLYRRLVRLHRLAEPSDLSAARYTPARNASPDARLVDEDDRRVLYASLTLLEPREQEVLRRRYGLDGEESETLSQIGDDLGLTKERIRQIQLKAERTLRDLVAERWGEPVFPATGQTAPTSDPTEPTDPQAPDQ